MDATNGTPFSPAEIVSPPVLTAVYEKNDLKRFGRYEDFKDAVFVLQANEALNLLTLDTSRAVGGQVDGGRPRALRRNSGGGARASGTLSIPSTFDAASGFEPCRRP